MKTTDLIIVKDSCDLKCTLYIDQLNIQKEIIQPRHRNQRYMFQTFISFPNLYHHPFLSILFTKSALYILLVTSQNNKGDANPLAYISPAPSFCVHQFFPVHLVLRPPDFINFQRADHILIFKTVISTSHRQLSITSFLKGSSEIAEYTIVDLQSILSS